MIAKDMKTWHKEVCTRDGFKCRVCGTDYSDEYYFDEKGRNQYVCGHHVQTKGSHPETMLDTDVGICIDKKCHDLVHRGIKTIDESILNQ